MKIFDFSQQGNRSNNEDSLGYSAGLFTVCDGMGGHNFGEHASAFVKDFMLKAFPQPQTLGKMEIQQQLNKVQIALNQLLKKQPELEKMGTTFTGVFLTPDLWYAAHIGDSRIYLFRPSDHKLWHTWDHSFVGELMRTHEITMEAGRFHPMSNRISKALIAQKDGKPVSASIVKIDELKSGDILLLCSDGVVEGWGDLELVQLFLDDTMSFEQKCEKLRQQCDEKSKDNNTAIVVEIEKEDVFTHGNNDELEWTTFAEVVADYKQYVNENIDDLAKSVTMSNTETATVEEEEENKMDEEDEKNVEMSEPMNEPPLKVHLRRYWPIIVAFLLVAALAICFVFKNNAKPDNNDNSPQTENGTRNSSRSSVNSSSQLSQRPNKRTRSSNSNSQSVRPGNAHIQTESSRPMNNQIENESSNKKPGDAVLQEEAGQNNPQNSSSQQTNPTDVQSYNENPNVDDVKNSDDNKQQSIKEGE